mmetsp:Transcript_88933/g.108785  ORF Transcript_88933/g.108785 Transcript_88933/m.108785 type:complete len:227 (-) Transcript_88933:220-900(-)|eukprot:CAMPEP_0114676992 /NCGR_PEP_ID=MMETSP0191-20121206/49973_1 /TAXON_ID=126664 /ORGANISM="Sorites sp." /LENGTH=226 /DNA_ID=CAMNT_0001948911 /DNA_START=51 /DNA_END=731 /DNA_ORIENTATION=+
MVPLRQGLSTRAAQGFCVAAFLMMSSPGFVPNGAVAKRPETSLVVNRAANPGTYQGFVPDMQRRQLMNVVLVSTAAVPLFVALGAYLWYFVPPVAAGAGGPQLCGDLDGAPISYASWVKTHKANARELVQGLKGEPYYIISTEEGIKDFALLSVCTHLGCVVPWDKAKNKFCCPCHGSQYDENGKVVRGPAPLSLALAHTTTLNGNLALSPWTEKDFRTETDPWWK